MYDRNRDFILVEGKSMPPISRKCMEKLEKKYIRKKVDEKVEFLRKTKFKKVTIPMFEKRDIFMEMSAFRNINRNRKDFKKAICLADIDSLSWTMVEYRNIPEKLKMEFKFIFGII
jgi:diphthamide biosynthesis methyltransferase